MAWTDDPLADYESYSGELEDALGKLPVCDICEEPIQDEYCYQINGDTICESCMAEYFRKETMDLMG